MTKALAFSRSTWAIAVYTLREGLRKKTLIGFLALSLLVIFGANFITAFIFEVGGTTGPGTEIELKLVKDICITAISIFGILITIFVSASVVPTEVDNKVVYTILSKPVRRFQYLLGKFIGVQLLVALNLALMGALFFGALWVKEGDWSGMLLASLLLTFFEFLIVSAFTFAIAATASSAVLPTIAGLFIYITGLMTEYLKDVANRAGQTTELIDTFIGWTAQGLFHILPNLRAFSMRNEIIYAQPFEAAQTGRIVWLIGYSLIFTVAGFILSYWVFRRREL